MPQPIGYTRNYDFTTYQETYPQQPLPAAPLDANLDNIGISIGQIISRLALIQRDDGALRNQAVTPDSLSNSTKALLGSPINPRGAWVTATLYKPLDLITAANGNTYIAAVQHTSGGSFSTDLAAGKWLLFAVPNVETVAGTAFFQKLSGTGATPTFNLTQDLGLDENGLLIFYKASTAWAPIPPDQFTINGTVLTFTFNPALGSNNIYVFCPSLLLGQASAYAAQAATSATNAGTSATNSFNSASAAATSATNAATSEANALTYRNQAQAAVGAVKVTTNDTTAGVLNVKLLNGREITKVTGSPGGNETLTIDTRTNAQNYTPASGTQNLNISTAPYFNVTPSGNFTLTVTFDSSKVQSMIVEAVNWGAFTVTLPTIKWPLGQVPVWSASGKDIIVLWTDASNTLYGALIGQKFA